MGALDGLQRSILSLRANWELIPLVCLQTVVAAVLGLLSMVPFYLVLDLELPAAGVSPDEALTWLMESLSGIYAKLDSPSLWLAVISSSAIMLALLACYSFFQAGAVGVLVSADRQAPTGRLSRASWFRTYSWTEFQGRGGRDLWRFFWLYNLVAMFWLGWAVVGLLALLAIGVAVGGAGVPAAMALGCASILPLLFLGMLLIFWSLFGQALIADSDLTAWQSLRRSLPILVRRLGAVVLLCVMMVLASLTMTMLFLALSLPLGSGLVSFGGLDVVMTLVLQLLQWLAGAVIQLVLVGAVVAIARSELARLGPTDVTESS